jgi:hypothetical protein
LSFLSCCLVIISPQLCMGILFAFLISNLWAPPADPVYAPHRTTSTVRDNRPLYSQYKPVTVEMCFHTHTCLHVPSNRVTSSGFFIKLKISQKSPYIYHTFFALKRCTYAGPRWWFGLFRPKSSSRPRKFFVSQGDEVTLPSGNSVTLPTLQCDEVKTHVVTNLESFQWSTHQCRQTIQSLLVLEILPTSSSRPSAMFPVVFHAPSP